MDFTKVPTPILLKTWENLRKGLDAVATSIENDSFHTVGEKGAAPPSQSGHITLWFATAVYAELEKRGVEFKEVKNAKPEGSRTRRKNVRTKS